eukprot:m51a1_g12920 putative domain containing protein (621) ;mRNA; r:47-3032
MRHQQRLPGSCVRLEALSELNAHIGNAQKDTGDQLRSQLLKPLEGFLKKDVSKALDSKRAFSAAQERLAQATEKYSQASDAQLLIAAREEFVRESTQALEQLTAAGTGVSGHVAFMCAFNKSLWQGETASILEGIRAFESVNFQSKEAKLAADNAAALKQQKSALASKSAAACARMVEYERKYITVLDALMMFCNKMQAEKEGRLSDEELLLLFGPAADLFALHAKLLPRLEVISNAIPAHRVALTSQLFEEYIPLLEGLYLPTVRSISRACVMADTLEKQPRFKSLMDRFCTTLDFKALRSAPWRHLAEYLNFIGVITQDGKEGDKALKSLLETERHYQKFFDALSEAKVESDKMGALLRLQSGVVGLEDVLDEDRQLVWEGDVMFYNEMLWASRGISAFRGMLGVRYILYIFSDFFAVASDSTGGKGLQMVIVRSSLRVTSVTVVDESPSIKVSWKPEKEGELAGCTLEFATLDQRDVCASKFTTTIVLAQKSRVFGVPLVELMTQNFDEKGRAIPRILEDCSQCIVSKKGLSTPGIFRLSVGQPLLQQMQAKVDSGVRVKDLSPIEAAAFLKAWLRSLPSALLVPELYGEWLEVGHRLSMGSDADPVQSTAWRTTAT